MADYQNIFTQVQMRSPAYPGVPAETGQRDRLGESGFSVGFWKDR